MANNNNIVLSWKLTDDPENRYAYIYPDENGKRVRDKVNEADIETADQWSYIEQYIKDSKTYSENFMAMCDEIRGLNLTAPILDDNFYEYVNDDLIYGNGNGSVNVILLSGQDGYIGADNDGEFDDNSNEIIKEFNEILKEQIDELKNNINEQNKSVTEYIENEVIGTISESKKEISDAQKEIFNIKEEFGPKLESAQIALEKASSLFNLSDEGISTDDIKNILTNVDEYGDWISSYSGMVSDLKSDYDVATGRLGSVGVASAATDGLFTRFATSLNTVSGTVGNVNSWIVASSATIGDMASWYDTNASSVTEASRIINASAAQISDVIKYVGNDLTSEISRTMDAKKSEIKDSIVAETLGVVTTINNTMNGLSGIVESEIARLNKATGELTSMGERMDASEQKIDKWMTITDSAMTVATDLKESWSVESGKLSTVANLIAETDSEGNVIYYVSGTNGNEIVVSITDEFNDEGQRIYKDSAGNVYYDDKVYTHLSPDVMSYIQQTASSVTMSVTNKDSITAAIKLAIEEDANGEKAIIEMVADEIVIDAEVIAEAIKAKEAVIGGIEIGDGYIKSVPTIEDEPYFYLDGTDGTFKAKKAIIEGEIYSDKGTIGGLKLENNMLKANDSKKEYVYFRTSEITKGDGSFSFNYRNKVTYSTLVAEGINESILELNDEIGELTLSGRRCSFTFTQDINLDEYNAFCIEEEKEGTEQTYAIISSSDEYEDDEMGKLVIGVGQTDSNCSNNYYYEYELKTSSDITESIGNVEEGKYNKIYLKKHYSIENCNKKDELVEAYLISTDANDKTIVEPISNYYFYYTYEILNESVDGVKYGYCPNEGKYIYYKDWVHVKDIASAVLDETDDESTPLGYSDKDIMLGVSNDGESITKIQISISRDEIGGGSGGGSGSSGSGSGGSSNSNGTGNNGSINITIGDSTSVSYPYVSSDAFQDFVKQMWEGNVKSDSVVKSAMVIGVYGYNNKCIEVDTTDFNTKIYADGTIITNNLISEDGYFGGDINSKGFFSGELKGATGTLNNVSITADTINTSLVISDGKSINAVCGDTTYFAVSNTTIGDNLDCESWSVCSFVWDMANKNGINTGKTYSEDKKLLKAPVKPGAEIKIPKMNGFVKRYAPRKKTNDRSTIQINCYIISETKYTYPIFNKMVDIPKFKGSGSNEINYETPEIEKTFQPDTGDEGTKWYLIIEFNMHIHLSTYSWLGMDKATGHVYFNTDTSTIEIKYKKENINGVHIGTNGMIARGNIYLYSPDGTNGIEITDDGVKLIGLTL